VLAGCDLDRARLAGARISGAILSEDAA
jgi:uncharacterized protein YjbI with pentapeptide repeats